MAEDVKCYEFGPFRIDTRDRLLRRGEELVRLNPQVIEMLLVLLETPGRVVEKGEFLERIWGKDTFVEEGGLARNKFLLTKILGEGYIETIPKRGYRFSAPVDVTEMAAKAPVLPPPEAPAVESAAVSSPPAVRKMTWRTYGLLMLLLLAGGYSLRDRVRQWSEGVRPAPVIRSLVVLPLENTSNDAAQEHFADGMTEELINSLAKIDALRVISWTTAKTYKSTTKRLPQIARDLDVDAAVEGSVLQSGGRVRIAVQLFNAKAEKSLWAQSFEKDLRDVLALQGDAASAIADEIKVKLTRVDKERLASARTVDPDAYLAYSYGRFFWNKRSGEDIRKAIEYFESAIQKDRTFAPPYAGLADAYALLGSTGIDVLPPRQAMSRAKAAAVEAVKLDDTLAEGHTSLAYAELSYDWDLDAAEREFKRALALNPGYATAHHWYAHYFLARGQQDQALEEIRRAQVVDPYSIIINTGVGWCLYHGRRYEQAVRQYRATLDLNPNYSLTHCTLGMALEGDRKFAEAVQEYNKASDLPGSRAFALVGLGRVYALTGKRREALQVLDDLNKIARTQYVPAVYRAAIYAALGDTDQSIAWMRKAFEEHSDYMVYLKTEPWADALRGDPRFEELLREIGPAH